MWVEIDNTLINLDHVISVVLESDRVVLMSYGDNYFSFPYTISTTANTVLYNTIKNYLAVNHQLVKR